LLAVVVTAVAAATPSASATPRVLIRPSIVPLQESSAAITVSNVQTGTLQVRFSGATDRSGRLREWQTLHRVDGVWTATILSPALRGVYPIRLRTASGASIGASRLWLLRVYEPRRANAPSFVRAIDAVRWWVGAIRGGTLRAVKPWPRPAFDRRDPRLHRLFVVAYSPRGRPAVSDRLGMFITAFRESYRGRWRLLEATVQP